MATTMMHHRQNSSHQPQAFDYQRSLQKQRNYLPTPEGLDRLFFHQRNKQNTTNDDTSSITTTTTTQPTTATRTRATRRQNSQDPPLYHRLFYSQGGAYHDFYGRDMRPHAPFYPSRRRVEESQTNQAPIPSHIYVVSQDPFQGSSTQLSQEELNCASRDDYKTINDGDVVEESWVKEPMVVDELDLYLLQSGWHDRTAPDALNHRESDEDQDEISSDLVVHHYQGRALYEV